MKNRYSNLIKVLNKEKRTGLFSIVKEGEYVYITTEVIAARVDEAEYNDYIKPAFPEANIEKGYYLLKNKDRGRSFSAKSYFEYADKNKDTAGEYATISSLCINSAIDGDTIIRVLTTNDHIAMINQDYLNTVNLATCEITYFDKKAPVLFTDVFIDVLICPINRGVYTKEDLNEWIANSVLRIA
jgi:hypothetical protein